jgi:hypothetical protein
MSRSCLSSPPKHLHGVWWDCFSLYSLNIQGAGSVRQAETRTAEPFVPEPSTSQVEVAMVESQRRKSHGGGTLPSEIHKCIKLIWNKYELSH